ncbi:hypothetical protein V4V36_27845 [Paenibacillus lautus]|uniref:hypothetical protein n=1 Tax=Paenibacillus lautus TaxID=1401 RepID=UPI0010ECC6F9|nr:hypothetical protein [Cytobacillus firmus]VTR38060.1 Uncharacterised protein [Actinobacillus pleuropneumoniae]
MSKDYETPERTRERCIKLTGRIVEQINKKTNPTIASTELPIMEKKPAKIKKQKNMRDNLTENESLIIKWRLFSVFN